MQGLQHELLQDFPELNFTALQHLRPNPSLAQVQQGKSSNRERAPEMLLSICQRMGRVEAATTAAGRASFLSAAPGGPLPWALEHRAQSPGRGKTGSRAVVVLLPWAACCRGSHLLCSGLEGRHSHPKHEINASYCSCGVFFGFCFKKHRCKLQASPIPAVPALCAEHVAAQKNRSLAPSKHPSSFQGTGQMRQGKAFHPPKRVRAELCQLDCILLATSSLPTSVAQLSVASAPCCNTNTSGVRGKAIHVCSVQHPGDIPQVVTFVLAGTPGFLPSLHDTAFSLYRFPPGLKRYLSLLLLPNAFLLSSLRFKPNSFHLCLSR